MRLTQERAQPWPPTAIHEARCALEGEDPSQAVDRAERLGGASPDPAGRGRRQTVCLRLPGDVGPPRNERELAAELKNIDVTTIYGGTLRRGVLSFRQ